MEDAATVQLDLENTTQHLRDFKLAIEFKHLMKHAPGGVYLLPEFENIRRLHGVIFIRKGLYRDGIFRFVMTLPPHYNSENTHPEIVFTPPVFNPLINPETGLFDLSVEENMQTWNPERHFIVTALTFLKKAFYTKSYDHFPYVANEDAKQMFTTDRDQYLELVQMAVKDSLKRVHDVQPPNCTIILTSNLGASDAEKNGVGFGNQDRTGEITNAVNSFFKPEFRNRLDGIVEFGKLDHVVMIKIVKKFIDSLNAQIKDKNVFVKPTPDVVELLIKKGFNSKMGARPLGRTIDEFIKKPLSKEILFGKLVNGGLVEITAKDDDFEFNFIDVLAKKTPKVKEQIDEVSED
jgi:ubiquitin-protein ligase